MTETAPPNATSPGRNTDHITERGGGFSGKLIILLTLSLFLIVPGVTALSLWLAQIDLTGTSTPLQWHDREQWTVLPASRFSLRLGSMASARRNRTYKDSPLRISAQTDQMMRRGARLANQPRKAFKSQANFEKLTKLASNHPEAAYPRFLLATWHRLNDDQARYDKAMAKAVANAQAVIIQPVRTADHQPAANLGIGQIDLGLDRVVDDKLDQSLVLAYPFLKTDELGQAYLPVTKSVYRVDDAQPENVQTPLPALPRWFTFPGKAGSMPPWRAE